MPRKKAYVLLYDPSKGVIALPVKAVQNLFTKTGEQYAGGCPAMFGGNVEAGHTEFDTVKKEVGEESGTTYAVGANATLTTLHKATIRNVDYEFFATTDFAKTGNSWTPVTDYATGEMVATIEVDLSTFSKSDNESTVLNTLMALCPTTPPPTAKQQSDFAQSETFKVLYAFITMNAPK